MLDWRLLLRGNLFQHILFPQLQKNARVRAGGARAKKSPDWPHAAACDFERCHRTSLPARSQSGVAMNSSTAMEHSCRIYDSMPASRAAKRLASSSARVVAQTIRLITIKCCAEALLNSARLPSLVLQPALSDF